MPSKKHRPIVMNRNRRSGRSGKIVKRILAITAILAFIEIIILVVLHFKNTNKTTVEIEDKPKEIPKQVDRQLPKAAVKDPVKVTIADTSQLAAENKRTDVAPKKDTILVVKPVSAKIKATGQKPLKDTTVMRKTMPAEVISVKKVSDEQMFQILNDVRTERMQANNPAKCVTIQIVSNSNAENGFKIANYLRKNGYIISGREVINGSQKGIQINATGPCIRLTIGSL